MKDIAGVEVQVGDSVAYAWSRGSASPIMKVGVVAKLTPKGVSVKTKGGGTRSILHFHQRGIVLSKNSMSAATVKAQNASVSKCPFDKAWVGRCGKEVRYGLYCDEHRKVKCRCGRQARKTCEATLGAFVCGTPTCGRCRCH